MHSKGLIEKQFVEAFRRALDDCSLVTDAHYNSFEFTSTGKIVAHPRTCGLIARVCWSLPGVAAVDLDRRFNLRGQVKFQPDITCVSEDSTPLLFVDYESPNSSDARIPKKDVTRYCRWSETSGHKPPYFILTSLPRRPAKWRLRYAGRNGCNQGHKSRKREICQNPFAYWYGHYRSTIDATVSSGFPIRFFNLDGKKLERVPIQAKG